MATRASAPASIDEYIAASPPAVRPILKEIRRVISTAAPDVAAALQVDEGATLMRLDRVIYTLEGKPAEWRLGQCLMDGRHYLAELK